MSEGSEKIIAPGNDGSLIVFFDGVCNLCNATIDLLLRIDQKHILRFAPLQGKTAARIVSAENRSRDLGTFVFFDGKKSYLRSDAVLELARHLGGGYRWLGVFRIVPKVLRDAVYRLVAHYRYRWFGKRDTCRLPTPEERTRFLD